MSTDPSLKVKNALARHRNVLSRGERIEKLKDQEKWSESDSVFALAKVANRKVHVAKKEKAAAEGEAGVVAAVATGEADAAAASAVKPAAGAAKPAAPAKPAGGGKGAGGAKPGGKA